MKKHTFIDYLFFWALWLFLCISVYEILEFLQPYYNFVFVSFFFILISLSYFIFKRGGSEFLYGNKSIDAIRREISENSFIQSQYQILQAYNNHIVYWGFIGTMVFVIISILFDRDFLLPAAVVLFFIIFSIAKFAGFQLHYSLPQKSSLSSGNAVRFFLITFGVFIVILTHVFNSFWVSDSETWFLYLLLWCAYVFMWGAMFFQWNMKIPKILSTYSILSMSCISILVWVLLFQNGFFQSENIIQDQEIGWSEDFLARESEQIPEQELLQQQQEEAIENISEENEILFETFQVAQEYTLEPGIQLWSFGENVQNLQTVLGKLQYYTWEISGEFDEATRVALSNALKWECSWPESTRWIFGPQAKACIDNLNISVAVN